MNTTRLIFALVAAFAAAGCQCCRLTDCYCDRVDCISESSPKFDALYCPALDVSRIGQPDWCACPVNRWWCPCQCNAECAPCE